MLPGLVAVVSVPLTAMITQHIPYRYQNGFADDRQLFVNRPGRCLTDRNIIQHIIYQQSQLLH